MRDHTVQSALLSNSRWKTGRPAGKHDCEQGGGLWLLVLLLLLLLLLQL